MAKGEKVVELRGYREEWKPGHPDAKGNCHYQVGFYCGYGNGRAGCGLHFIVMTWHPENWKDRSAICPECGKSGATGGEEPRGHKLGIYEFFGGSLSREFGE